MKRVKVFRCPRAPRPGETGRCNLVNVWEENMKALTGNPDDNNRVPIGAIRLN